MTDFPYPQDPCPEDLDGQISRLYQDIGYGDTQEGHARFREELIADKPWWGVRNEKEGRVYNSRYNQPKTYEMRKLGNNRRTFKTEVWHVIHTTIGDAKASPYKVSFDGHKTNYSTQAFAIKACEQYIPTIYPDAVRVSATYWEVNTQYGERYRLQVLYFGRKSTSYKRFDRD
jgi:hypothetical protein